MPHHFPAAPWSSMLKVISTLATLLLPVLTLVAFGAIPAETGFTHVFGLLISAGPPAILFGSLLFVVTGYVLDGPTLSVKRLLWRTQIPLVDLRSARVDPEACKRSIRVFGNGGLYSFTGLYQNSSLGRFRMYATDPRRAVVLVFSGRTVVVTPASPETFLENLRRVAPFDRHDDE